MKASSLSALRNYCSTVLLSGFLVGVLARAMFWTYQARVRARSDWVRSPSAEASENGTCSYEKKKIILEGPRSHLK